MIKAILFDMNGIIIDDENIHEMAFRETVKLYNINLDHQAYLDCCAGRTDRAGYEKIVTKFSTNLPIDDLLDQKSKIYLKLFPANKRSYPGVIELIHSLSGNFILALTSSSSRKEVDLVTNEFGINHEFKVTISSNDIRKGKPDPEPYLITANKLGFEPKECVAIEDSRNGVISAKAAGCYCIGVITTHKKEDLVGADLIVGRFAEINTKIIHNIDAS
jgi:HAD superfamily hydrolase (TIGR01509 family)